MPRTAQFDRQALAALVQQQHGVVARAQVLECGMTERVLTYRSRVAGPWQRLVPGVYLTHTGNPADEQRELAALLYAGPMSVLRGTAALRRHGLSGHQRDREPASYRRNTVVDVLVPAASQRADAGFARLHRTGRLPELICVSGGARFALPSRAVADAVRSMANLSDVRAVVAEAVQRNRCSISQLAEELTCGPIRGSALLRQVLAEVREGIRSSAEGDLRDLIAWARLPTPMFNPRLMVGKDFLAMPDCWWPEPGVAAEADSRAWHLSPADWENTMTRHARMSAQGIIVLHFTPAQIRAERKDVASTIRKALEAGAGRSLPHIRAIPST